MIMPTKIVAKDFGGLVANVHTTSGRIFDMMCSEMFEMLFDTTLNQPRRN